jgi:hypothetical protein
MTSEGLGEVFKGDFSDTCAGKFPLVSMGGRANGQACADGERGPPSARAEILLKHSFFRISLYNVAAWADVEKVAASGHLVPRRI